MIIFVIPEKESGQKAPWLESYCSFTVLGDLLRALQNQISGTKWPCIGLKNGRKEYLSIGL